MTQPSHHHDTTGPVAIPITAERFIYADLIVPRDATGVVVLAHGSGSGRASPRNRVVARDLQAKRFGTVLVDLLTPEEERRDLSTAEHRFDVALLAKRLVTTIDWAARRREIDDHDIGLFAASTGAAAALVTAARRPERIAAVVSRGGRPDLAADVLPSVRVPTLLIVGGSDHVVLRLNAEAQARLRAENKIAVVPGASHLFEEPGALEEVSRLTIDWFRRYLVR